jgi:peptidyl-Lys metalloendopeptidase
MWFGSETPARRDRVIANYNSLKSHLLIGVVTAKCDCPAALEQAVPGIIATVHYPAFGISEQAYKVHLCTEFFTLGVGSGFDSQGGTMLHEMAHFDVVNGVLDYCSGEADCQQKAMTDPDQAIRSGDTYQYFAESLR